MFICGEAVQVPPQKLQKAQSTVWLSIQKEIFILVAQKAP